MPDELTAVDPVAWSARPPRWFWFVVVAGAYLTLRGYHSFDGDQAYRLPLLLHRQDPTLYATDPFVRAVDAFNPHRGYLALLDAASRPFGLAAGLGGLFALTLGATMLGIDRLARAVGTEQGARVGLVAVVLVLVAKAGNIGTNHLFEGILLDRLVAFALGWLALGTAIIDPRRGVLVAAPLLGMATLVHPSVGLQITLTLTVAWVAWAGLGEVTRLGALGSIVTLGLALLPGIWLINRQTAQLLDGMPLDEFRNWAVRVQGPQHMLPSTWRLPQWLAFGCYPVLAGLAYFDRDWSSSNPVATRFGQLLLVNVISLTLAYVALEVVGDLRVTLFQPFRMATLARGLCLIAVAGRLVGLWNRGDLASRGRAILVVVGLAGDWTLVVATTVELAMTLVEARRPGPIATGVGAVVFLGGLVLLTRHDTEAGHLVILAALSLLIVGTLVARIRPLRWNRRRLAYVALAAWAVPALALGEGLIRGEHAATASRLADLLLRRCRFAEIPLEPVEQIAAWCSEHTPATSRFIGPPGEKGFRLWSRRPLAFNRAGSPYHAAGLRDWSERFRDHVGFAGTSADFARAYLAGRHALEAGYDRMTPASKLALARRQGATHVLECYPEHGAPPDLGPDFELLVTNQGYAVYRVR